MAIWPKETPSDGKQPNISFSHFTARRVALRRRGDGNTAAPVPWCLCQTLWSGSRSSGRRQTCVLGRGCLSAERRCNLTNRAESALTARRSCALTVSQDKQTKIVFVKVEFAFLALIFSLVQHLGSVIVTDSLWTSCSSLLISLNILWYWLLPFEI